jgi:hypothetical protein
MYKSVRILLLGLLIFGFLTINCHKATPNSLRVVQINKGKAIEEDVVDYWTYTDPEGGGVVETQSTPEVIVPVEIAYTELGSGLPTYPGPYTAKITKYTVTVKDVTTGTETDLGDKIIGACNFLIPADPDMKNTVTQDIKILPYEWIITNLGDLEGSDEEKVLKATVRFDGVDELSGKTVSDSGYVTIDAADFEDDPNKLGS